MGWMGPHHSWQLPSLIARPLVQLQTDTADQGRKCTCGLAGSSPAGLQRLAALRHGPRAPGWVVLTPDPACPSPGSGLGVMCGGSTGPLPTQHPSAWTPHTQRGVRVPHSHRAVCVTISHPQRGSWLILGDGAQLGTVGKASGRAGGPMAVLVA